MTEFDRAQAYVGTPYIEGEFDCADLAVQVQAEVFGKAITLPAHHARGRSTQAAQINRLAGTLARRIDEPVTGAGVLLQGGGLWHIGTVFMRGGDVWVLHNSADMGSAALWQLPMFGRRGMNVEGYYAWL
jgi:hypothetical protein